MINLIKNLLIFAMLGNIILPMAGYAMEPRERTTEDEKNKRFTKEDNRNKHFTKKLKKEKLKELQRYNPYNYKGTLQKSIGNATQKDNSLSQQMFIEDTSPKERDELDYRTEHERVKTLFECVRGGCRDLNLDQRDIFSLPNDTETMRKLSNCRYFSFSHNMLDALPDEICEWTSMISLDLSNNKLTIVPWQVFGLFNTLDPKITIFLTDNPIKRIPSEFFDAMIAQEGRRGKFSGFSIEFNQEIIENYIFPELGKSPVLKSYLVRSFHGDILNGFCKIQNETGEFLSFDEDEQPFFAHGQGTSL